MRSKKRALKKQKLLIVICILILVILGALIYFINKNKKIETSDQPMKEEEIVAENSDEENINNIEETPENTIDENIENNNNNNNNNNNSNNNNATNEITNTSKTMPYYIKVNYGAQVVTIYKKDANGDYTVPVKAMICSTGTATPKSGVYSIPQRWTWGALFGNVYGHYCIKITGNILFHSVPYLRWGDNASLEYWEYDKLGTAASAGCVRLKVEDVKWIFDNCANGTKVEFYSSSDPGPLGKPSAKKISDYPDYLRNWDPTDPNPNNPWKNYKENENENTNTNDNQNETTNDTKPDNSVEDEEKNEVTNNVKPDSSEKNEMTNSTNTDNSEENEMTNSINTDSSEKNEQTNNVSNNINENQNNVLKNETQKLESI